MQLRHFAILCVACFVASDRGASTRTVINALPEPGNYLKVGNFRVQNLRFLTFIKTYFVLISGYRICYLEWHLDSGSLRSFRILRLNHSATLSPVGLTKKRKVKGLKVFVQISSGRYQWGQLLFLHPQFHNLVDMFESFELMAINQLYRKYQPTSPIKANPRAW